MSVTNFIPTLWSRIIFKQYDKNFILAPLTNREYEGEITAYGDTVKINEIGEITVSSYTGSAIDYQTPDDASKFLKIDQRKYAAVELDDIDATQASPKIANEVARKLGISLADNIDQALAGVYDQAGLTTGLGTTGSAISITSATVVSYLSMIATLMGESNCPTTGRVAVVPPWFAQKLVLAKITKDTNNSATLMSGYVGSMMGFDFYESNNIKHSGTSWYAPIFFMKNDTIAFAEQISDMEALRSPDTFKDRMRALLVYGFKVVRPNSLATLICSSGSETA